MKHKVIHIFVYIKSYTLYCTVAMKRYNALLQRTFTAQCCCTPFSTLLCGISIWETCFLETRFIEIFFMKLILKCFVDIKSEHVKMTLSMLFKLFFKVWFCLLFWLLNERFSNELSFGMCFLRISWWISVKK